MNSPTKSPKRRILWERAAGAALAALVLTAEPVRAEEEEAPPLQTSPGLSERLAMPQFTIIGPVARGNKSEFSVNGEDFVVGENATVEGDLALGKEAEVSGIIEGDGKKVADNVVVRSAGAPSAETSIDPSEMLKRQSF